MNALQLALARQQRVGFSGSPVSTSVPLKPGVRGTAQTIAKMQALCADCVQDPRVRRICEVIAEHAQAVGGDRLGEARAIFDFVRRRVTFRRDPTDTELVHDPRLLLKRIQDDGFAAGDCDDHSLLIASLGHTIRLPIVWVLVGPARGLWEHIYAAMESPRGLVALDTAAPNPLFGRHAPAAASLTVPALKGL